MVDKFSSFITRKAATVLLFLMTATMVPLYFAVNGLSLNVVLEEMLPANANNVQLFKRFGGQFGGANTTLVEVTNKNGDIYSKEFLQKYKEIAEEIYYNEDTQRHLSQSLILRKTKVIRGSGGSVEVTALLWPDLPETDADMDEFRRAVNKQFRGLLVSDDERSAVIIADFKDDINFEETLEFFQELRAAYEDENMSINVVGRPVLLGTIYQSLDTVFLIMLVSFFMIGLVLYLYFGTWVGVFVPMFTASIATVWGLGAMGFMKYNLDPLLILLPAFIFAIVLSHGVQLTSRILTTLNSEGSHPENSREITRKGLASVLIPSTGAIFTDAAGFAVLGLVAIPSIQGLALICGVWLLSICPALILASTIMCLLPPPKKFRTESKILNRFWSGVGKIEDHKYLVIGATALLLCCGIYYSANLTVGDTKGSAILWPDSRYNQDSESINERFSFLGTDVMQVYIEGDEETMLDPEVYQQIEAMDRYVYENMPEVRPAQSLVPIIRLVNSVLYEGDPSYELLPDNKDEIGFDIYMYRSRGEPGDFAAFTNNEWEIGNVSFFLQDHSSETIAKITKNLKDFFAEYSDLSGGADFLFAGGQVGLNQALNEEISKSNQSIMVAISLVILVCLFFLYRSVKVGLIFLMSLATANALTYAYMTWKGVGLNVSSLPLSALGVGLGVDYGIYILDRVKEEFRRYGDLMRAMHEALKSSGSAIVITAVTMITPLIPWMLFSPLRFQSEMATLIGIVLLMNMLGALLFIPAALIAFKPKSIFPDQSDFQDSSTAV